MPLYLLLLLASIGSVLGSAFVFERSYFSMTKYLAISITIVAIPFLLCDVAFTHLGVWGFTPKYLTGIHVFNLPIEEFLFFFVMPYCTMFIYYLIRKRRKNKLFNPSLRTYIIFFSIALLGAGALFSAKLYTSIVCISLGVVLLYVSVKQVDWFEDFFLTLIIHYIPFIIINGLLTSGIQWFSENPVVWYDSTQILNIRITSIPLEDFLYSFLLFLLNLIVFEDILRYTAIDDPTRVSR